MKSTTKTTAVSKRPPVKTAKAEVKKGGKKADFSMLDEIKKEEQRAADVMAGKRDDSDDPTSVEYQPSIQIKPIGDKVAIQPAPGMMTKDVFDQIVEVAPSVTVVTPSREELAKIGMAIINGGKKKRGAGLEPAYHPRESVTTQVQASAKAAARIAPQPATENVNKRITPGTAIKEWRVVKSLRAEFKGWFLQGGLFKPGPRGNQFFVGAEERYLDLAAAKEALKNKRVA